MAVLDVYNVKKEKIGQIEVSDDIFARPVKEGVIHQVVVWQLAKRRAGTACTKTRGEVSGGGRKPWRQKGTGRARHGSIRSPIWVGGGVVHGPRPRDWSFSLPKGVRRAALKMALSAKLGGDKILVIDDFGLTEIKTKKFAEILRNLGVENALVVTPQPDENLEKSARNLPTVKVLRIEGLNVYDIIRYDYLILHRDSIPKIEERLAKK
ncbi:50S ribosomal protein L4 [Thermosulfuriphilus sp.]